MTGDSMLGVGFSLHPDLDFLELAGPVVEEHADYFEVNPETLWRITPQAGAAGAAWQLERNDYHALFREIQDASGKPFVAHGLGYSIGSAVDDPARQSSWLERIRDDHECFAFEWMSEHLGLTQAGGEQAVLPLPLPFSMEAARTVECRLAQLGEIVPLIAIENSANYFAFGRVAEDGEAYAARACEFLNALLEGDVAHLLLDLHNVHTEAINFGFDPFAFVDRLDLSRVLQIHVSGGSESEADWLASGRVMRLDSHDGPVPARVWSLLEHVLPHCHALRGVVVERLNGSFVEADVPDLIEEMERARALLESRVMEPTPGSRVAGARARLELGDAALAELQASMLGALQSGDALEALARERARDGSWRSALAGVDDDGFALTGLIVRKLRFERLCRGDDRVERRFEADPEAFTGRFLEYALDVPATAYFPSQEADLFAEWSRARS